MYFRYFYGAFVGTISILAILLWGEKGIVVLALLALRPLVMRWKKMEPDERELSLFHKTNTITMGIIIFLLILLYFVVEQNLKDIKIPYWLTFFAASAVAIQGIVGFILLKIK
jgi:hypothetical protein